MNYDEYGWRSFLTEARKPAKKPKMYTESRLLRELDEDEYSYIQDAIDSMEPEDMAFNDLFEGKTRLVIDFQAFDDTSDLGKFAKTLQDQGFTVDWEKGMVFAEREVSKGSGADDIMAAITGARPEKKKKKIQMKIGKLFGKIADVARRQDELLAIIQKKADRTLRQPGNVTGTEAADALNAEQLESWERLHKQMSLYIPNPGLMGVGGDEDATAAEMAVNFQNFWKDNAEYIKKNMDKLYNDRYSIIITRDPVDILRMSDFNRITSCHSPPSREQQSEGYFKCAVAEAHGHGAVAYAVNTEELLKVTETDNLEAAEAAINTGEEIFADDIRGSHIGIDHNFVPLSRVRLRQVRAHAPNVRFVDRHRAQVEVAVPETRVYGSKIPGFQKRVAEWAKESQAQTIAAIPENAMWIKYGGSYEDNNIKGLIHDLTGISLERVGQNTETEDSLPEMDFLESTMAAEQERVNDLAMDWTYRYQACTISGDVTYDGAEGYYVEVDAKMTITWDVDDWNQLPDSRRVVEHWADELRDFEWGFMDDSSWGTRLYRQGEQIHLDFQLEQDYITGGEGYTYNADAFEDVCIKVNEIDDMYDGVKGELTRMAKRDGYMDGGAINEWGSDIDNGSVDYYEWDMTADEEDHMTYSGIEGSHTAYPAIPEGMSIQDARTVLESRDFTIPLRKALVEKAWAGTQVSGDDRQYPNFRVYTEHLSRGAGDEDIRLVLTFYCNDNSSEAQVKSMRWTIEEWEDEEVLDAAIQAVFDKIVGGSRKAGRADGDWDEEAEKRFQALAQREKESSQEVTNESIVKNWKNFLYS